ncbi:hypothetical protein CDAR_265501 [Caerostris darwini]|uniref:Uncharacterized protein n=1 Tax=Caerostris darwini TaxID=1538125 RepID=A0AAV4RFD0_9ARAC|nr:hypothetical protein CDAR_265501 [Caerostris darwini]
MLERLDPKKPYKFLPFLYLLSSDFLRVFKIKNRSSCVIRFHPPFSWAACNRKNSLETRLAYLLPPQCPRLFTSEWSLRNIFCATTLCCSGPPPHPFHPFVYFISTLFGDSRPRLCCDGMKRNA